MQMHVVGLLATLSLSILYAGNVYAPEHSHTPSTTSFLKGKLNNGTRPALVIPPLYYSNTLSPDYSLYYYHLYEEHRSQLRSSSKLNHISFNNIQLLFDGQETPFYPLTYNPSSVTIYTCKHGTPVLVKILSPEGYTFYSLDPISQNWKNHKIELLKPFAQVLKDSGIVQYIVPCENSSDKYYDVLEDEYIKLSKELCRCNLQANHESAPKDCTICGDVHTLTPQLEISIDLEKSQAVLSSLAHPKIKDSLKRNYSLLTTETLPDEGMIYYFQVDGDRADLLKNCDSLSTLSFNSNPLLFDEKAVLPDSPISSLFVFTCKHNIPLLILTEGFGNYWVFALTGDDIHFYNHAIESMSEYAQTNERGITSYKVAEDGVTDCEHNLQHSKLLHGVLRNLLIEEFTRLSEDLCDKHNGKGKVPRRKQYTISKTGCDYDLEWQTSSFYRHDEFWKPFNLAHGKKISANAFNGKGFTSSLYSFDYTSRHILKYPNILEHFQFGDRIIHFSLSSVCPLNCIYTFEVYTSTSTSLPILIRCYSQDGFSFLVPDPVTGVLSFYYIDSLKDLEISDSTGFRLYHYLDNAQFVKIEEATLATCELLSRNEPQSSSTDLEGIEQPPLHIAIKPRYRYFINTYRSERFSSNWIRKNLEA